MKTLNFKVGTHFYVIRFTDDSMPYRQLLPSHGYFRVENIDAEPLFEMTVVENLPHTFEEATDTKVGEFNCPNAIFYVAESDDGSYIFRIYSLAHEPAATIFCDRHFRTCHVALSGQSPWLQRFGMENCVMLAYTYASAYRNTLLIHASVAVVDGKAYAFLGKSGTGKSTHCELWLKHIPGAVRLNDDNPVIEILPNGEAWIYGTPWSGKTPVYKTEGYRLGGLLRLHQAPRNEIRRLKVCEGYASMRGSASLMVWDAESENSISNTINKVLSTVKCYDMQCLPDEAAARMSHAAMTVQENGNG